MHQVVDRHEMPHKRGLVVPVGVGGIGLRDQELPFHTSLSSSDACVEVLYQ